MSSQSKKMIPPLISDMISKMLDIKEPAHIRDNYRMSLDVIVDQIQAGVATYEKNKRQKGR